MISCAPFMANPSSDGRARELGSRFVDYSGQVMVDYQPFALVIRVEDEGLEYGTRNSIQPKLEAAPPAAVHLRQIVVPDSTVPARRLFDWLTFFVPLICVIMAVVNVRVTRTLALPVAVISTSLARLAFGQYAKDSVRPRFYLFLFIGGCLNLLVAAVALATN